VQPAFDYLALDARTIDPDAFTALQRARPMDLVVFTSTRAVTHGLAQLPRDALLQVRVAAIGPATASALRAAQVRVDVSARGDGFTSEALLESLSAESAATSKSQNSAFIVAAPGGRQALPEGLAALGWRVSMLMVYRSAPAALDRSALAVLEEAADVLSVWTSGNAMTALSQRLPPATWFRLCRGEWLVISERLKRLARAYGPSRIHLASGPGNGAILAAIRGLG
jgi:uroporphyrinogen-III synthase